ncbi:MAG: NAD(P)/FAD-dependent oxidoreductase [Piscinibacter sp.]|uniref:NAD(P)/FAD-dependent oxidoreductase n=1 Tax=Piscinibacter sp. TaxID=1903157 RepID=UPI00258CDD2F|nr:NAD(P)/FAD-dependent oxidoreductase [Piscinibacter sp.]MCW5662576.1 NAD(P)/FAD-dependent oxidoreductase [Piscinibacter sp.]
MTASPPAPAEAGGLHRIVVVGGGAGGLELATRLGNRLGKRGKAHITLIEKARTHFWKPHLHEIAAGSADLHAHATDYLAQSHWHGFRYRVGEMVGLDREKREVIVAPARDEEGQPITVPYTRGYDTLVIAVGSQTNDFGTPGVAEHAIALETPADADRFHRRLVNACFRAHVQRVQGIPLEPRQLQVAIIGAGATGVELSAELHNATRTLVSYGLDSIDAKRDIRLNLIEAGPRILPALPERISGAAHALLARLGVQVRTGAKVTAVAPEGVTLASGELIPAELVVWAAGVKAPDFLRELAGLETNRLNQLVVEPTLASTRDPNVFALGDCAAAPWLGHQGNVPPRAQAAHQQATHLARQIERRLKGQALQPWTYRDFGSLVSLGEYSTVGNLMGSLVGGNLWVEGLFARWMYLSLYKLHELALHGFWKTALGSASRILTRGTEPRVKLH